MTGQQFEVQCTKLDTAHGKLNDLVDEMQLVVNPTQAQYRRWNKTLLSLSGTLNTVAGRLEAEGNPNGTGNQPPARATNTRRRATAGSF